MKFFCELNRLMECGARLKEANISALRHKAQARRSRPHHKTERGNNMNCWKGICKYKTDNGGLCTLDKDKGLPVKPCDMEHEPQHTDKCRHFDALTCRKHCYAYLWCQET